MAEAREKLAALMRSKKGGKEIADETGEQKKERERRERVKRDNKHAFVPPPLSFSFLSFF